MAALAAAGPVLLGAHTLAFSATVDFSAVATWRRLWSDLAVAITSWVEATHGPAPPQDVVARGKAADSWVRETLLRRIDREGLPPTRPLRTLHDGPFVRERIAPGTRPYDDRGRAVLVGLAFRARGGIAPFLILWLGWVAATPVLAWLALELSAAGYARAAFALALLFGLSPFVVETLALPRYSVGFYLVALLGGLPLAAYARLRPAPSGRGLAARAVAAAVILVVCAWCRSSAALLLPSYLLACWWGVRRLIASQWRRAAAMLAATALFTLPVFVVGRAQRHDVWQPLWEGLGDFDRVKGHVWSDDAAETAARAAGAPQLWSPESERAFRDVVVREIAADPAWFAGILLRRLASTVSLWKLWPWTPTAGTFLRRSVSPNEGVIDKYWTYTTTLDHFGFAAARIEVPIPVLLAPAALLIAIALRGRARHRARDVLALLACPAVGALVVPILITTAGGQETQAFGIVYLLAAALAVDLIARRSPAVGAR